MKKYFIVFIFVFSQFSTGQVSRTPSAEFSNLRRNIATIIFCGLGGAVLGLSTLSFYGQPQEHIGNITTGLGIGTIAGAVYVTTQSAMEAKDNLTSQYKTMSLDPIQEMNKRYKPNRSSFFSFNFDF